MDFVIKSVRSAGHTTHFAVRQRPMFEIDVELRVLFDTQEHVYSLTALRDKLIRLLHLGLEAEHAGWYPLNFASWVAPAVKDVKELKRRITL